MNCTFCGEKIHFYEAFYVIAGNYYHTQAITPNAIRCNRKHSKVLEKVEKEIEGRKS